MTGKHATKPIEKSFSSTVSLPIQRGRRGLVKGFSVRRYPGGTCLAGPAGGIGKWEGTL